MVFECLQLISFKKRSTKTSVSYCHFHVEVSQIFGNHFAAVTFQCIPQLCFWYARMLAECLFASNYRKHFDNAAAIRHTEMLSSGFRIQIILCTFNYLG